MKENGKLWLFVLCFCTSFLNESRAQTTDTTRNIKLSAYPVLFYLPETKLGFGVAGIATFRFQNEKLDTRPSQVQFGAAYTLNKQLLFFLPFELYINEEKWKIKGELGYYDYFYDFYGIGIESELADREKYFVKYPRTQVWILRRIGQSFFGGLRYFFDGYNIISLETDGLLDQSELTGKKGGTLSGLGWVVQFDNRDHLFYPTKGWFIEGIWHFNKSWTGSDFNFSRYSVGINKYFDVGKGNVLALNLYSGIITGNPPFNQLYYFGTPTNSRGFQDRRFQDRNIALLQSEWRFPLWKRFGGVLFGSCTTVSGHYKDLLTNTYKLAGGGGLRFLLNKRDGVRLRLDIGFTEEGSALYLTVKEAF